MFGWNLPTVIHCNRPATKSKRLASIWAAFDKREEQLRTAKEAERLAEEEKQREEEAHQLAAEAEEKKTKRPRKRRKLVLDSDEEVESDEGLEDGTGSTSDQSIRLVLPAQTGQTPDQAAKSAVPGKGGQLNAEERLKTKKQPVVLPTFTVSPMPTLEPLLTGMKLTEGKTAASTDGDKMADDPLAEDRAGGGMEVGGHVSKKTLENAPKWEIFQSALGQTHSWESLTDLPDQKLIVAPYVVRLHH